MEPRRITYNPHAFLINGQPTPLISGAVHYFRIPPELWPDRLRKAKQGGLTAIETYVAWNFHESEKGKFDFTAARDLNQFLTLCEAENLFVILRPGPYICAESNFGGFPAWLGQEPGVKFRTFNPVYLKFVDRWFDALFAVVAPHLLTRGGSILLVQAENEFGHISQEDFEAGQKYLYHLRDKIQSLGVDVPIITCDGGMPGCIQCINSHRPAEQVPEFLKIQPNAPLFSTEFWSAWYDVWGEKHHTRDGRDLAFHTLKFVADGAAGYNYYMYHGGTNFGYSTMYLQTTSYDFHAPISEAGGLTPKYFHLKQAADFLRTFSEILLTSAPEPAPDVLVQATLRTTRRESNGVRIIFLENPAAEAQTTPLQIGEKNWGELTLPGHSILPIVLNFQLSAETRINGATLFIQQIFRGHDKRTYLLLSGAPGTSGQIELQHHESCQTFIVEFETDDFFLIKSFHEVTLIFAVEALANQNQLLNQNLMLLGAEYVRHFAASGNEVHLEVAVSHSSKLRLLGAGAEKNQFVAPPNLPALPKFSAWRGHAETTASLPNSAGWRDLPEPVSMLALGNFDGYGWYRTQFDSPRGGRARLLFSDVADRILVWLNGTLIGTSATPPEDRKGKFPAEFEVHLEKGENSLGVLADNLGLAKGDWQIGRPQHLEAKGLLGPVHVSNLPEALRHWQFLPKLSLERETWSDEIFSRWPEWVKNTGNNPTYFATHFDLPDAAFLPPLRLDLSQMSKGLAWLNGRLLGRYWKIGPETRLYLPEPWLKSRNTLVLFDEEGIFPEAVQLAWDEKNVMQPVKTVFKYKETQ
jgi:hypothetical protein